MTKTATLQKFFEGFGLPAYPQNAVPTETAYPWITYESKTSDWGDSVSIAANLYYHTTSEKVPNAKAEEISRAVGLGGVILPCDGGAIWLKKSAPFITPLVEQSDPATKRRQLLFTAEFLTN